MEKLVIKQEPSEGNNDATKSFAKYKIPKKRGHKPKALQNLQIDLKKVKQEPKAQVQCKPNSSFKIQLTPAKEEFNHSSKAAEESSVSANTTNCESGKIRNFSLLV